MDTGINTNNAVILLRQSIQNNVTIHLKRNAVNKLTIKDKKC